MGDIIETERKVTHMKLAERVEAKLDDQKFLKSQKLGADVCPFILGAKSSLIQISWSGHIPPSFKVEGFTISVHQLYPMTIIFTAV